MTTTTTTERQPRTPVLIGTSVLALGAAGVGLSLSLSAGPAGAESVPTGRSTSVVQPQDAAPEVAGRDTPRDTSRDATRCVPLFSPVGEDPDAPLLQPLPDPAPPVCDDSGSQTP